MKNLFFVACLLLCAATGSAQVHTTLDANTTVRGAGLAASNPASFAAVRNYTAEATNAITSRISGKTAGASTEQVFSLADDNAHNYIRNPALWCADLDFTCVSASSSVGWRITLISPRQGLTAYHITQASGTGSLGVGTVGYWVDGANVTYSATVTNVLRVVDDMALVTLDHELPATIHPAWVLPATLPNGFQTGAGSLGGTPGGNNGVPVITHDQNRHFCIATLNSLQYQTGSPPNDSLFMQSAGLLAPWNRNNDTPGNTQGTAAIGGDSSSPYFIVVGGQPVLLGCFASTVGAGPDPGGSGGMLQALLGVAGYKLNVMVMPDYPVVGGGGSSVLTGSQSAGVQYQWGNVESWNGAPAQMSLQGFSNRHGLLVHTTGNQGMALIGWSSTGAQAGKFIQDSYFTQPALTVYRSGGGPGSAAAIYVNSQGNSNPLLRLDGNGGRFQVNNNGSLYMTAIADSDAGNNALYFSTTQNKLCYKDPNGAVHSVY